MAEGEDGVVHAVVDEGVDVVAAGKGPVTRGPVQGVRGVRGDACGPDTEGHPPPPTPVPGRRPLGCLARLVGVPPDGRRHGPLPEGGTGPQGPSPEVEGQVVVPVDDGRLVGVGRRPGRTPLRGVLVPSRVLAVSRPVEGPDEARDGAVGEADARRDGVGTPEDAVGRVGPGPFGVVEDGVVGVAP